MAPTGAAYNTDWIVSTNSNVHVANNRAWFTSYSPFKTHIGHIYNADHRVEVAGIGDVQLNVKLYKHRKKGRANSRIILLRNVLYVPTGICNIIGSPILAEYKVDFNHTASSESLTDKDGNRAGLIDHLRLPRLRLHGQPGDFSSLGDGFHMINAQWPATERVRWVIENTHPAIPYNGDALYAAEEKAWLRTRFGGEYKFLRQFGLSIYKEEDRELGRSMARTFMKSDANLEGNAFHDSTITASHSDDEDDNGQDSDDREYDDCSEDDDDGDDFLPQLEDDPISHLADYNFSQAELKWIKQHYGHSANFMFRYGLKPFNQDDCDEAIFIVKAMMGD
jgi:hypothetical protein